MSAEKGFDHVKITKADRPGVLLFLLPALILFFVFFVLPIGYLIIMSFFRWDGMTSPTWAGFSNYLTIFSDKVFWRSFRNNIIWAVSAVVIQVPLAVIMAMILAKKVRGWKFFRTVYFLPQVISGIAIASMWSAVFNSEYGLLNSLLKLVGLDSLATNWLGNPKTAFPCVLIYGMFYIGYYMVIIMSGIAGIDDTYYEAATLDGASGIQTSVFVILPMIKDSVMTAMTLAAVFGLRTFEQIYLLTNGGPANRTSVLVLYLYNKMRDNNYGTASATSIMLILTGVIVIISLRSLFREKKRRKDRRTVYNDLQ